jgi:hypothetical protein
MKPVKRIENLIKERRYKASAETYDKALDSFLQAVDEHVKQKAAPTEPKVWRTIMNSRITKIAAAALVIIAAYVVLHQSGGSIDGATVTFAQITENMQKMPWLHAVIEGERGGTQDRLEAWVSFERRINAQKRSDGTIGYLDSLKQIGQVYDPDANTITISHDMPDALAGMGGSAADFPELAMKLFADAGAEIIRETGKYKGKDVKILKMSAFLGGMDMKLEMTVDAEKNVLLFVNQKAFDKDGKLMIEANGYFDYPETGPESIYDLGVPASARTVRDGNEE